MFVVVNPQAWVCISVDAAHVVIPSLVARESQCSIYRPRRTRRRQRFGECAGVRWPSRPAGPDRAGPAGRSTPKVRDETPLDDREPSGLRLSGLRGLQDPESEPHDQSQDDRRQKEHCRGERPTRRRRGIGAPPRPNSSTTTSISRVEEVKKQEHSSQEYNHSYGRNGNQQNEWLCPPTPQAPTLRVSY